MNTYEGELSFNVTGIDFPEMEVWDTSLPVNFYVTNTSQYYPVFVDAVFAGLNFQLKTDSFPQVLRAGQTYMLSVRAAPKDIGEMKDKVVIITNQGKQYEIPLTVKAKAIASSQTSGSGSGSSSGSDGDGGSSTDPSDPHEVKAELSYWTEETKEGASLLQAKGSGRLDAIIEPKSNGAFRTSSSGNARGTNAIDLQSKNNDTQVASGNYSIIAGGANNTASAIYSIVVGGNTNLVSGQYSSLINGTNSRVEGNNSFLGYGNRASITDSNNSILRAADSTVSGNRNSFITLDSGTIEGNYSQGLYFQGTLSGQNNTVITGRNATVSGDASFLGSIHEGTISGGNNLVLWGDTFTLTGENNAICWALQPQTIQVSNSFIGRSQNANLMASRGLFIGNVDDIDIGSSDYAGVVSGQHHTITNSDNAFIGGGSTHGIFSSPSSSILGGSTNTINESTDSSISGGTSNSIKNITSGLIAGGSSNNITRESEREHPLHTDLSSNFEGTIIGGQTNILANSLGSLIAGSNSSNIDDSEQSLILGSNVSEIKSSKFSSIIGEDSSSISKGKNVVFIGGDTNTFTYETLDTSTPTISLASTDNSFTNSYGIALSGSYLQATDSKNVVSVIGDNNTFTSAVSSAILMGVSNTFTQTNRTFIFGGDSNTISNISSDIYTKPSFVLGSNNTVDNSQSYILLGSNVTAESLLNTVIIGDGHIVTGSNQGYIQGIHNSLENTSSSLVFGTNTRATADKTVGFGDWGYDLGVPHHIYSSSKEGDNYVRNHYNDNGTESDDLDEQEQTTVTDANRDNWVNHNSFFQEGKILLKKMKGEAGIVANGNAEYFYTHSRAEVLEDNPGLNNTLFIPDGCVAFFDLEIVWANHLQSKFFKTKQTNGIVYRNTNLSVTRQPTLSTADNNEDTVLSQLSVSIELDQERRLVRFKSPDVAKDYEAGMILRYILISKPNTNYFWTN